MSYSYEFNLRPINLDYYNIDTHNDKIYISANFGSLMLSSDKGLTWNYERVFDNDIILKTINFDNKIYAFNINGQIALNESNQWKILKDLKKNIIAIDTTMSGFIINFKDSVTLFDKNWKNLNSITTKYNHLQSPLSGINSIIFKNSKIYILNDSVTVLICDSNLNLIDKINLNEKGIVDNKFGLYRLYQNDDLFYIVTQKKVYSTKDFNEFTLIFDSNFDFNHFINFKNRNICVKLYPSPIVNIFECKNGLEFDTLATYDKRNYFQNMTVNSVKLIDDDIWLVGGFNYIQKYNIGVDEFDLKSLNSSRAYGAIPIQIDEKMYYSFGGNYNLKTYYDCHYNVYLTKTKDTFKTFQPIYEGNIFGTNYNLGYKYFDSVTKSLYYFESLGIPKLFFGAYISYDLGKNYIKKQQDKQYPIITDAMQFSRPNLQFLNNHFIFASSNLTPTNVFQSSIYIFDTSMTLKKSRIDSNFELIYLNHKSFENYLLFKRMFKTNDMNISYTQNDGKSWHLVKEYTKDDSILFCKDFQIGKEKYLLYFILNKLDSVISLESINLDNYTYKNLYNYKQAYELIHPLIPFKIYCGFDVYNDKLYLSIKDTLFITNNIFDKSKWSYTVFPNNGGISRTLKVLDSNSIYAYYQDANNPREIYIIDLPEMTIDKPIIQVTSIDFGKKSIKDSASKILNAQAINTSSAQELIITNIENSNPDVFITFFPEISEINPLIIKPNSIFNFPIKFQPKEVKEYYDSLTIKSNATDEFLKLYIRGIGFDTTTSVEEVELLPYLYAFPPFPIPGKNHIKTLIYFEPNVEINKSDIGIYDQNGNKIERDENINIDYLNNYSGYLIWECKNAPTGIYLIHLKFGESYKTIKVMVNKEK